MCRFRPRCGRATSSSSPARCRSAPDGAVVAGGIEAQTRQVVENVEAALKLAGARLADVVKTTVILADARDFGAFNKVYAQLFPDRSAGPDDAGGATDDRHQGRDRGDRLQAEVKRLPCASSPLRSPPRPTRSRRSRPTGRVSRRRSTPAPGKHPADADALLRADGRACAAGRPEEGFTLIEGTAAWAEPGGLLQRQTYEELRDEILDQLRAALPVDAVDARPARRHGRAGLRRLRRRSARAGRARSSGRDVC